MSQWGCGDIWAPSIGSIQQTCPGANKHSTAYRKTHQMMGEKNTLRVTFHHPECLISDSIQKVVQKVPFTQGQYQNRTNWADLLLIGEKEEECEAEWRNLLLFFIIYNVM